MKVIQKNNTYKFIPESISECFKIYVAGVFVRGIKEGGYLPPFYLPVAKPTNRDAYELWILPLAPFVWLIYLIYSVFMKVWYDMQNLIKMIYEFTRK